jgi:hypothetical protein
MKKTMESVTVEVWDSNEIAIVQPDYGSDHPSTILISPDQVELIIRWLREAKKVASAVSE